MLSNAQVSATCCAIVAKQKARSRLFELTCVVWAVKLQVIGGLEWITNMQAVNQSENSTSNHRLLIVDDEFKHYLLSGDINLPLTIFTANYSWNFADIKYKTQVRRKRTFFYFLQNNGQIRSFFTRLSARLVNSQGVFINVV